MKRHFLSCFIMAMLAIGSRAELAGFARPNKEGVMAYCTIADLQRAYGEDRVAGWSRRNPDTAEKAIADAGAEIDGYLLSGGYAVPLPGTPETVKKYCVDIAAANLVISAGVLEEDPGGKGIIEHAKIARRFLEKVAEGKFRIPGYRRGSAEVSTPL
jgi:phage gp36-like protein